MSRTKLAEEYTPEERAALLARFEASGQTPRAFAASVGIPPGTLSHWRWRQRGAEAGAPEPPTDLAPTTPTFVPVTLTVTPPRPRPASAARYEFVSPTGFVVRFDDDFERATLRRVLATLEGGPC